MGFRFRKSINLGAGFKINLSKSGIGYSWGTRGYRISRTVQGTMRRTYSIPGTEESLMSMNLTPIIGTGARKERTTESHSLHIIRYQNEQYRVRIFLGSGRLKMVRFLMLWRDPFA